MSCPRSRNASLRARRPRSHPSPRSPACISSRARSAKRWSAITWRSSSRAAKLPPNRQGRGAGGTLSYPASSLTGAAIVFAPDVAENSRTLRWLGLRVRSCVFAYSSSPPIAIVLARRALAMGRKGRETTSIPDAIARPSRTAGLRRAEATWLRFLLQLPRLPVRPLVMPHRWCTREMPEAPLHLGLSERTLPHEISRLAQCLRCP